MFAGRRAVGALVATTLLGLLACGPAGDSGERDDGGGAPVAFGVFGTVRGASASGVTISLTGASDAVTITDASGRYCFTGLPDGTYTVTPARAGFTFSPPSLTVTVSGTSVLETDFTATVEDGDPVTQDVPGTDPPEGGVAAVGVR